MQNNFESMVAHLNALFGNSKQGLIEIAYTPSDSGAVNKAEFFNVTDIQKAARFAQEKNSINGVNVYVGAALRKPETAPFMRSSIDDFMQANAVWVDLDDAESAKTAKEKYKDLPPSFVIVTGRHPNIRAQAWWILDNPCSDAGALKTTLAQLCHALDGDKAVVDSARVMRLGGSIAYPKKQGRVPELTEFIIPSNKTDYTSLEALQSHFPLANHLPVDTAASGAVGLNLVQKVKSPLQIVNNDEWSLDDIQSMLDRLHPDSEYMDWLKVGMALKDYGVPFEVWDTWSQKGAKYNGSEMRRKWDSFKGSGTSFGSLVYFAKQSGWKPKVRSTYNQQYLPPKDEKFDPVTGEIIEQSSRFPLLFADEIEAVTESTDFIEDLLRDNEFSVVYGESNCGKTFFMLDLAMHVALGKKWRGKQVEQGGVIYAALEGGHGTKNRIVAFKKHYNITGKIPLAVIPSNLNFLDTDGDLTELANAIKQAQGRLGRVRLIVIDTLARAISGGDENSSMDMGQLVINADILRSMTGAHIAFIHHSGKDTAKGARGHSSLRAAVDTEIEISRPDTESPSSIKVVKQREMEMIDDMAFSLSRIELGTNQRGKAVTSCVVIPADVIEQSRDVRLTAMQQFIYDALIEALDSRGQVRNLMKDMPPVKCVYYDELREVLENRGYKEMLATENKTSAEQIKSATQTVRVALKRAGKINFDGKFLWLV